MGGTFTGVRRGAASAAVAGLIAAGLGTGGAGIRGLNAGAASAQAQASARHATVSVRHDRAGVHHARLTAASSYALPADVKQECPAPSAGTFQCMALVDTSVAPSMSTPGGGYGPQQLQSAYHILSAAADSGQGTTVALVEAGGDPSAVSDFNAYRSEYHLPPCDEATGAGCLTKADQVGATTSFPAADPAWAVQSSMDADAVAAICPNCRVLLVEADSDSTLDLYAAARYAATKARYVSLGFGAPGAGGTAQNDQLENFALLGTAVTAAAGDSGYGTQAPASSQFVVSVGGTTLTKDASGKRGWQESVWAGTGAGCSPGQIKPSWQTDTGCPRRTQNDVAADANPKTGIAFFDSAAGGWREGGGTNVSSAIIAAVYALAGDTVAGSDPALYPYADPGGLYEVTTGSDGSCSPSYLCTAGDGYNGPAGLGTPDGTAAFAAPGSDIVSLMQQSNPYGTPLTAGSGTGTEFVGIDTLSGDPMTLSISGQTDGLSIPATCDESTASDSYTDCSFYLRGVLKKAGRFTADITATDAHGKSATYAYTFAVADAVAAPSVNKSATIGTDVSVPYSATSVSGQRLDFSVTGLPPGISYTRTGPDQMTFTGSPTANGRYTTTVTAANTVYGGSATGTVSWTMHGTITFKPVANITGTVGSAGYFSVSAADSVPGDQVTYSWRGMPPGINQLYYPDDQFAGWLTRAGTYQVTVTASGEYGASASRTFTWAVTDPGATEVTGPIRLDLGGKCLDHGTGVRIWNCNGTVSQGWVLAQDGTIRALGECLTESGTAFRSSVTLARCTDSPAQRWRVEDEPVDSADGWAGPAFVNGASGHCLGDPSGNTNGAYPLVLACNVGPSKTWLTAGGPVESGIPGMCLADPANRTANGTRLVLWHCYRWHEEQFTFAANGTVQIHGKCVYINPSSGAASAPLMLETCGRGNRGEQWAVYGESPFAGSLYNPWNGIPVGADSASNGGGNLNGTYVGTYRGSSDGSMWRPF